MNRILNDRINLMEKCFFALVILIAIYLSFVPYEAHGAINVDGKLDETEWAEAQRFTEFAVTEPFTQEKPPLSTEALVSSTPEGLAVAFICKQPDNEARIRTVARRDAPTFDADSVSLMIDFDGAAQFAYEFSVSISDSYRDGTIIQENQTNYDWDGQWKHSVNEEQDRWTVEMLLPWSVVSMRIRSGEKRQIGICFQRQMQATNEKYAFPIASSSRPRFMSDFAKIEVANYASHELDITPYVTALGDLLENHTTMKAGLDLLWKPSGRLNVIGTFNPDFGTVESDNLVINFSAIETSFSEKRPFFIENQRIFDEPDSVDRVFYTRRIGGPSDKDREASDIKYALKVIGSTDALNYGFFAAQEADSEGRSFYAGRVLFPANNWTVGLLSTYVERPFLNRTALVNCLEYTLSLNSSINIKGIVLGSSIKTDEDKSDGFGIWDTLAYASSDNRLSYNMTVIHFDDKLDINDMGYMQRNNFEMVMMRGQYNQMSFSADSSMASVSWPLMVILQRNTDGFRFPTNIGFSPVAKFQSGAQLNGQITLHTRGFDDMISRGNGIVELNKQWSGNISYSTPRRDTWGKSIQLQVFQEGIEKWGTGLQGNVTWYPKEGLNVNLTFNPQWSSDWLKWVQGKQLGSFSRQQVNGGISVNWFPAEDHEIWLKTQWYTVNAKAIQSYNIGNNGILVPDNAPMQDFVSNSFALQFRYRYEFAPGSDLWFCYSRGGSDYVENPDKDMLDLLGESIKLRDSDQILLKLSYRFKAS
jgi:hypothetical protein